LLSATAWIIHTQSPFFKLSITILKS